MASAARRAIGISPCPIQRVEHGRVPIGCANDGNRCKVLGRRAEKARSADVDLLGQLVEVGLAPLRGLREGIEVDRQDLEWADGLGREVGAMLGAPTVGEQTAVDARVEGLDPTVEHLRHARDGRDIGDRESRLAERLGRPAGRNELEAPLMQTAGELGDTGLVRDRQERSARRQRSRCGAGRVDPNPAAG